jgi:hypothetical protein
MPSVATLLETCEMQFRPLGHRLGTANERDVPDDGRFPWLGSRVYYVQYSTAQCIDVKCRHDEHLTSAIFRLILVPSWIKV